MRNYTPGERAICLIGVMAGKSLTEINEHLSDFRPLNPRSYELLKTVYMEKIWPGWGPALPKRTGERMWEHCMQPSPMGNLKSGKEG